MLNLDTFYGISIPLLVLKFLPTAMFFMDLQNLCDNSFPLSADCVNTLTIGLQGVCPT